MNPQYFRAVMLYQQRRYDLAEQECHGALTQEPEDGTIKALLARCQSELGRQDEALATVQEAIAHAPDRPECYAALAHVHENRNEFTRGLNAIEQALEIDPFEVNYWAVKSQLLVDLNRWQEGLEAADEGLALDAESLDCANLRSICLQFLGRYDDAAEAAGVAMEQDPDDSVAHANQGWIALRSGDYRRAEEHFAESLRLSPGEEWAREGMISAIKARNPIYRGILKFWLWMSTLSDRVQWIVLIGLVVGRRVLQEIGERNPELEPYTMVAVYLVLAFVILTWIANPLFDLTLFLHPLGRHALTRGERIAAISVGGLLALGIGLGAYAFIADLGLPLLVAMGLVAYAMPVSATFAQEGTARLRLAAVTGLIGAVGIAAVAAQMAGAEAAGTLGWAFVVGIIAFTWLSGLLVRTSRN